MREHVDRRHVGDAIIGMLDDVFQIPGQSRGIAAHIDEILRAEADDIRECVRMHAISWRIDDKEVRFFSFLCELLQEILDFGIDADHVRHSVQHRIGPGILTRLLDNLNAVDLLEILRQDQSDSPGSSIEIEGELPDLRSLSRGLFRRFASLITSGELPDYLPV